MVDAGLRQSIRVGLAARPIKIPGQEPRRHPEAFAYRCFLSDLTRFAKFRRAGPTQAGKSIPQVDARVKD